MEIVQICRYLSGREREREMQDHDEAIPTCHPVMTGQVPHRELHRDVQTRYADPKTTIDDMVVEQVERLTCLVADHPPRVASLSLSLSLSPTTCLIGDHPLLQLADAITCSWWT